VFTRVLQKLLLATSSAMHVWHLPSRTCDPSWSLDASLVRKLDLQSYTSICVFVVGVVICYLLWVVRLWGCSAAVVVRCVVGS
jgi:hypothetical protein